MRSLLALGSLATLGLASLNVYHLAEKSVAVDAKTVGIDEALMFFSDEFNLDSQFRLGDYNTDEIVELIEQQHEAYAASDKPKLVVTVHDIKLSQAPSFIIDDSQNTFSSKFNELTSGARELTHEIRVLAKSTSSLASHFQYFNLRMASIWENFKKTSKTNYINSKFFINEVSQLVHLNEFEARESDVILVNINSLASIAKLGSDSNSYETSEQILMDLLSNQLSQFDVYVIDQVNGTSNLRKRDQELNLVFKQAKSSKGYFESEEACQVGTSNCNSHGICTKLAKGSWSCVCSATVDKNTTRTSNWAGFDCSKQDISTTANLLLWTTVALLVLFVGGVKLLASIGNEPLPGVLDSAVSS